MAITAAALFFLGCGACNSKELESPEDNDTEEVSQVPWETCGYDVGDHLCDFDLLDQNGDTFVLYDNIGVPIVLDFSTMWCSYCQVAAQEAQEVQDNYSAHNLLYVTVLIEDATGQPPTVEDASNWSQVFGIIDPPVLVGSRDMIDTTGTAGFSVTGWPTFLFVTDGMVLDSGLRGYSASSLDAMIQDLLTE